MSQHDASEVHVRSSEKMPELLVPSIRQQTKWQPSGHALWEALVVIRNTSTRHSLLPVKVFALQGLAESSAQYEELMGTSPSRFDEAVSTCAWGVSRLVCLHFIALT